MSEKIGGMWKFKRSGLAVAVCGLVLAIAPSLASAGQWAQVSCVNPDGSAATNQGWATSSAAAEAGSDAITSCSPSSPMTAFLSASSAAPTGADEALQYTPPAGSNLAGGTINVSGTASGGNGSAGFASGSSDVYAPQFVYNGSNVVYQCTSGQSTCQNGDFGYSAQVTLPSNEGGDLYLVAACGGSAGYTCNQGAQNATWSQISLSSADLLLSNSSVPSGSGFGGTLLSSPTQGSTASLLFTAGDANGPGVYSVSVAIDGTSVYAATPDTDGGTCASVGTYSGTTALEFDTAQPCPQTESVDVPVDTAGLLSGNHELTVSVTDAAGNSTTVLDQIVTITAPPTTALPTTATTTTPVTKATHGVAKVRVRFVLDTRISGTITRLLKATALKLAKNAQLTVSDSGPRHPKLKVTREPAKRVTTLLRALTSLSFHTGDTLLITVTEPGRRRERLELTFRTGKQPIAKLLS